MEHIHATCIAVHGHGVILRGASGSGKSDLALRLVDEGAQLVADDLCRIDARNGQLVAFPPDRLAGFLEVRGLGIVPVPSCGPVPVSLLCDLRAGGETERLPETDQVLLCSVPVRRVWIDPFRVSATAHVRLALRLATGEIVPVS